MEPTDSYAKLIKLLDAHRARYRILVHRPAGETRAASQARGHPLRKAAKSLVVRVGMGRRSRRYVLCVVPGDKFLDLKAVEEMTGATDLHFARRDIAESLTASVSGTIPPFSFNADLEVVADRSLLACDEMFFNAGRFDRSLALRSSDYLRVVDPRVADISKSR
jgi:Ala-tRNA(Pro) deacylase